MLDRNASPTIDGRHRNEGSFGWVFRDEFGSKSQKRLFPESRVANRLPSLAQESLAAAASTDDIHRVFRELEAALSEGLNAEPTNETTMLKDKLIRELTQSTDA